MVEAGKVGKFEQGNLALIRKKFVNLKAEGSERRKKELKEVELIRKLLLRKESRSRNVEIEFWLDSVELIQVSFEPV